MRQIRRLGALILLVVAVAAETDCQQVIGIPDRTTRPNVVCASGSCACAPGFGDCDANLANGCEVNVATDQNNCGACGVVCANGTCAASECTCNAGYADCDANAKNGCETDLASAPNNCGACGHDCGGGGCDASLCTAVVLATDPEPDELLLYAGNLYWLDFDGAKTTIYEVPAGGGQVQTVAIIGESLLTLAVTGSQIFSGSPSNLYRVDTAAHTTSVVYSASAGMSIEDVTATNTTVFVLTVPANGNPGEVVALDPMTLTTSSVSTDVDSGNFTLPVSHGEPVWLNTESGVSTVVGGMPMQIANVPTPVTDIAADDEFIWALSFGNSLTVTRIDPTTGAMLTAAPVPSTYGDLAGVGSTLAWSDNDEDLDEWDGTSVTKVAQNLHIVSRIAIDAQALYATNDLMQVVRIAR